MTGKRSERKNESPTEKWDKGLRVLRTRSEQASDTYDEVVEFYVPYLCGVLDTLTEFKTALYAGDVKKVIKETVESILRDGRMLQQRGQ